MCTYEYQMFVPCTIPLCKPPIDTHMYYIHTLMKTRICEFIPYTIMYHTHAYNAHVHEPPTCSPPTHHHAYMHHVFYHVNEISWYQALPLVSQVLHIPNFVDIHFDILALSLQICKDPLAEFWKLWGLTEPDIQSARYISWVFICSSPAHLEQVGPLTSHPPSPVQSSYEYQLC